jgi:putative permease
VVTIPVVGVALFQFGAGTEFWSLFAVYLIIQGLDGNLLVRCCSRKRSTCIRW